MAPSLRRLTTPVIAALLLVLGGFVLLATLDRQADAAVNHGAVVPEQPRTNVPRVIDGAVYAHAQVGARVFVGGDFSQVQLPDGSIINQANIFAYNIDTGAFDVAFQPVVNNEVRALAPTPTGDGLYVGGKFTRWDNSFPIRVAKLDTTGNLNTSFNASASAMVRSIVVNSSTVFIGGDFVSVSGSTRLGMAAVDAQTGALDPGFVMDVTQSVAGGQYVRALALSSDGGTLYALHFGNFVNGQPRETVAKINVAGPTATLADWRIEWDAQAPVRTCRSSLRDIAISPDDSFIVVGGQGADYPPNCDSILRYSTAGTGVIAYDWSARMYSSVYSLAVTDVAIYAGGHFCAAPKNPILPGGISSDFTGTADGCDVNDPSNPINPSERDPDNAVFRMQIAALDPTTGQALAWDPGSDNFQAVFDLTVIDRGLLAGHDGSRFNNILTGRSGFFDFGAPVDTTPPTISVTEPADGSSVTNPTQLAGTAADNGTLASVTIRLKNITDDVWLQPDGTFGPNQADLPVTLTPTGLGTADWSFPVNNLPSVNYEIRGFSTDSFGNTSDPLVTTFAVNGGAACNIALDGNDDPVISWTNFDSNNVTEVFLRRDGTYLATGAAGSSSYTDTTVAAGDHSYLVRWRPNGPNVDVPCTPDPITVPGGGGGDAVCTVALNVDDKPVLTWSDVPANTVVIRDEGGWIATVDGVETYTVVSAVPGDHSYLLRYSGTDLPCTPQPITVPGGGGGDAVCTVALNVDDKPVLTWSDVPANTVVIRDEGGWIATVDGVETYTVVSAVPGDHSYLLRYSGTDLPCTPQPITVPDGPGVDPLSCTIELVNGDVLVNWTAVPGDKNVSIRTQNGWVASVGGGALTYTDTDPEPGPQTYIVRYKDNGNVDTVCTPDPLNV